MQNNLPHTMTCFFRFRVIWKKSFHRFYFVNISICCRRWETIRMWQITKQLTTVFKVLVLLILLCFNYKSVTVNLFNDLAQTILHNTKIFVSKRYPCWKSHNTVEVDLWQQIRNQTHVTGDSATNLPPIYKKIKNIFKRLF